jgi:hypothetical protein
MFSLETIVLGRILDSLDGSLVTCRVGVCLRVHAESRAVANKKVGDGRKRYG